MRNSTEISANRLSPTPVACEAPRLTLHGRRRMESRGISPGMLRIAITHGEAIHRQGLIFYVLRAKDIPGWIPASQQERLANLVAVTCEETGEVITCYKNKDAMRNITMKPKRLKRYSQKQEPNRRLVP